MKTYHTDCNDCWGDLECPACNGSGVADYTLHELVEQAVARVGWDPDDVFADVIERVPEADTYDIQEALNELSDAYDDARKEFARQGKGGLVD